MQRNVVSQSSLQSICNGKENNARKDHFEQSVLMKMKRRERGFIKVWEENKSQVKCTILISQQIHPQLLQIYLCEIGGGGINNGVYDIVLATSLLVKAGKKREGFQVGVWANRDGYDSFRFYLCIYFW